MDPLGPSSGAGTVGRESDSDKKSTDDNSVTPQTSEGEQLDSDLSERFTAATQVPRFGGFMKQSAVLVESDEDSVDRTFEEARDLKQGARVCYQVMDDMDIDSSDARRFEYGRFCCWEITNHQGEPCALIHPHPEKNQAKDFWTAVDDRRVGTVVNLSGLSPDYLDTRKPTPYPEILPDFPEPEALSLKVSQSSGNPQVKHFQLDGWPDGGRTSVQYLETLIRHLKKDKSAGPLMVHCHRGLGRAGCFVQLMLMIQAVENGELDKMNAFPWFLSSLTHSRENRGFNQYVQGATQFQMLLEELIRVTGISENDLVRQINQWAQSCGWEMETR